MRTACALAFLLALTAIVIVPAALQFLGRVEPRRDDLRVVVDEADEIGVLASQAEGNRSLTRFN